MSSKLTITINSKVFKKAKLYSRNRGISLSKLVENYLRTLHSDDELSPRVKRLLGAVKLPIDFDYKNAIRNRE